VSASSKRILKEDIFENEDLSSDNLSLNDQIQEDEINENEDTLEQSEGVIQGTAEEVEILEAE